MTSLDLQELHTETLHICDDRGDLVTSGDPFPACRRRAKRFHLAWSDTDLSYRFRDDTPTAVRHDVASWARTIDPDTVSSQESLDHLADIFSVPSTEIRTGPAYYADSRSESRGNAVPLTGANESCCREGFLEPGEIDVIQPSFAVIIDDIAVSTCLTVRRNDRAIEAGVDTLEPYRGNGYAVDVTTAWINAAIEAGFVPFYSTSSDNTASQRVAQKSGLTQFATELGIP